MEERIVVYDLDKKPTWWQNKRKGLINTYFRLKRDWGWELHRRLHPKVLDYDKIPKGAMPILVNCYNRREPLELMMEWLLTLPNVAILLIDNNSTYPPLLSYYQTLDFQNVQVVYLGYNSWKKGAAHIGKNLNGYLKYIVTDPDLLPDSRLPYDLITKLSEVLDAYPEINHVGPSLEIEDLPDHNPMKEKIIRHESEFWKQAIEFQALSLYPANIDSTFAMYRKNSNMEAYGPALRLGRPYTLQHLDWYMNPDNITEEYAYYLKTCGSFATWAAEMRRETLNQG